MCYYLLFGVASGVLSLNWIGVIDYVEFHNFDVRVDWVSDPPVSGGRLWYSES